LRLIDQSALAYWEALAGQWRIVPPLAPSDEDVKYCEDSVRDLARSQSPEPVRAILLGVTPALATMGWPKKTSIVAVDWSANMLRRVWPRQGLPRGAAAVRCDWRELPLATASRDFAVGDGCYSAFGSLEAAASLNREMGRVLRQGGLYCLRCFCRPDRALPVAALFDDLFSGRLRNLDLFRWLLAMTVHGESRQGVRLRSVWRVWKERVSDPEALRDPLGWSEAALTNMERWGTLDTIYYFPTLAELRDLADPCFDLIDCDVPRYEWGESFPRLLMRARGGA
jgi:SAM-dependent methyltransferase